MVSRFLSRARIRPISRLALNLFDSYRLQAATDAQRNAWQIAGGGYGIHWPELDEDLSVEGLLRGAPAP